MINLHFYCDILIVGTEFDARSIIPQTQPHCVDSSAGLFEYYSYLPQFSFLIMVSSSITYHDAKQNLSQSSFMNMTMNSLFFSGLQSLHLNVIEHLGHVVEYELNSMNVIPTTCKNCVMLSC